MGLFDPAHRKILDKSPQSFRSWFEGVSPRLETIIAIQHPKNPDRFRAAVIGLLAAEVMTWDKEVWPPEGASYAMFQGAQARQSLNAADQAEAKRAVDELVDDYRRQHAPGAA